MAVPRTVASPLDEEPTLRAGTLAVLTAVVELAARFAVLAALVEAVVAAAVFAVVAVFVVVVLGAATTAVTLLDVVVAAAVFLLRAATPPFQLFVLWQPLQS
jgi:hypothetical protein